MPTVLITGGTGLVGKAVSKLLVQKGYHVIVLSRQAQHASEAQPNITFSSWNVKNREIDILALQQADYIIHLAGAGVMDKKWTEAYKTEIVNSRVESGKLIAEKLQQHPNKIKAVISASAIGWYAPSENVHTENEPADDSFLGSTCKLWEESMEPVIAMGKRLVKLRIGIVLSKKGGALKEFIQPLKFGVAAILGNGNQMVSWVHIDDLCSMFLHAIEKENMSGAYNAVAPEPVNNKKLTLTLAQKMKGKFYLPMHVPVFILKLILGQRSIEILKSTTASSKKIEDENFSFQFRKIEDAIDDILKNN